MNDPLSMLGKKHMRHGILCERASIARGRFDSDCGRICGIHLTQGVEAILLNSFHKKCIVSSLIDPFLHNCMHI